MKGLGLVVLVVAAALALAACGGSTGPHVASLPASDTGASAAGTTTSSARATSKHDKSSANESAKGNPTAFVDEWATCMQSHGDPNQAAPTIDAYGVINVTIPAGAAEQLSGAVHAGVDPCNRYIAAAQTALRAAHPVAPPPDQTEQIKYVNCMRANGVPNYPYPTGNRGNFNGTGVDPNSPAVMRVNNLCGRELNLPAWWIAGTGPPGDVTVSTAGIGPNGPVNGAVPNRTRPAPGASGAGGATPVQRGG